VKDRAQEYEALVSRYKHELRSVSINTRSTKIVEALSTLRASIETGYMPGGDNQ